MKNTFLSLVIIVLFTIASCSKRDDLLGNSEKEELQKFATENKLNINQTSPDDKSVYWVSSTNELKKLVQEINTDINRSKKQTIGNQSSLNSEQAEKLLSNLLNKKKAENVTNDYPEGEDPPYTHSSTVYFDNTYPAANVYVTINYNVNSYGYLTSAQILTGTWGNSIGGYTQTNVNAYIQNGILVFVVTGQLTSQLGISPFGSGLSLNGGNTVTYTGVFQVQGNGGGATTGWVRQEGGTWGTVPPIVNN